MKILFLFFTIFLSFSASATLQTIAPLTLEHWSWLSLPGYMEGSSAAAACASHPSTTFSYSLIAGNICSATRFSDGYVDNGIILSKTSSATCPVDAANPYSYSSSSGLCERNSIPFSTPPQPKSKYAGANGGSVCLADGSCTGSPVFDTPAAACADLATQGVYANAHIVASMVGATTCKSQLIYDDGTKSTPKYQTMVDLVPCSPSDTSCGSIKTAAATAAASSLASAPVVDSAIQRAKDAVAAGGGSAADIAAAGASAAGQAAAGTSGASGSQNITVNVPDFCQSNPSSIACQSNPLSATGNVTTPALASPYVAGSANGGASFSGSISSAKNRFFASGIGSAATNFFTVTDSGGACPVWSTTPIAGIGSLTFDFYCGATFQNLLPWIKGVIMLIFSVVAFRIAIL